MMSTFSDGNICYFRETSSFVRKNSNFDRLQVNITEFLQIKSIKQKKKKNVSSFQILLFLESRSIAHFANKESEGMGVTKMVTIYGRHKCMTP